MENQLILDGGGNVQENFIQIVKGLVKTKNEN